MEASAAGAVLTNLPQQATGRPQCNALTDTSRGRREYRFQKLDHEALPLLREQVLTDGTTATTTDYSQPGVARHGLTAYLPDQLKLS